LCHHFGVIRAELGLGILGTALWIYCLFDVIMTDESRIRNLPKVTWIFIVLVTSVVGAVAWLVGGRPQGTPRSLPYKGNTGAAYPEYERPGRFVATNPDDDVAFLRQVRERAEAQTAEAKRQRLERERLEAEERERRRPRATDGEPDQVDPA
jgi:signal transduction histidine kinase